jgi:hypothetical protein
MVIIYALTGLYRMYRVETEIYAGVVAIISVMAYVYGEILK